MHGAIILATCLAMATTEDLQESIVQCNVLIGYEHKSGSYFQSVGLKMDFDFTFPIVGICLVQLELAVEKHWHFLFQQWNCSTS